MANTVGSQAQLTINYSTWENSAPTPSRARKTKAVKEIKHPIFAAAVLTVTDPFWIEKLTNASYGTFPKLFSFADNVLTYKKGKGAKHPSLEISNDPAETAINTMEFMRAHAGIFSSMDSQLSQQLQLALAQDASASGPLTWANANEKVRDCLLDYYISAMKEVMNLNRAEEENLRRTLHYGITNKLIDKNNIELNNNRIRLVHGLLWDATTRMFTFDPRLQPSPARSASRARGAGANINAAGPIQKDTIPQYDKYWKKIIERVEQKARQYDRWTKRATGENGDSTSSTHTDVNTETVDIVVTETSAMMGVTDDSGSSVTW